MWNARLDEAQAGIKMAGRNINNLRHADDTTLMTEGKEELKSLLLKVKTESEKSWIKTQHSENKDHGIWSHHFMGNRWGNGKQCQTLFSGAPESVVDSDCSLEIKRYLLLGRKAMSNLKESERRSVVSDSLWPPWTILQTKILEWVAFPFSRGYSWSRDQTQVFTAGGFFTS